MTDDYAQKSRDGNRVGLHYRLNWVGSRKRAHVNSSTYVKNIFPTMVESAKSGWGILGTVGTFIFCASSTVKRQLGEFSSWDA